LPQFSGHRAVVRFQRHVSVSVTGDAATPAERGRNDRLKMALQQGDLPGRLGEQAQIGVRLDEGIQTMWHDFKVFS